MLASHEKSLCLISSQFPAGLFEGRVLVSEAVIMHRLYDSKSEAEGKAAAKAELRKHMSLSSADVPLVGVVTRLTPPEGHPPHQARRLAHS